MKEDSTIKRDWWEIVYLVIFGMIFVHDMLDVTMFNIVWPPKFGLIFYFLIMMYTLAKLKFGNCYSKRELVGSLFCLAIFIVAAFTSGYSFLFELAFLVVGAKNVSFDKILKVYFLFGIFIMFIAAVAAKVGWIENLVYTTKGIRNSFGMIYPTDFAAHIFYLSLAGACLLEKRIYYIEVFGITLLGAFVYWQCAAYTSTICLIGFAILLILIKVCWNLYEKGKLKWLICFAEFFYLIPCILFLVFANLYNGEKNFWNKLDNLLSLRLQFSKKGIEQYGYTFLGQPIKEVGLGRTTMHPSNNFFLDDSYLRILLEYGILVFAIVMFVMFISNRHVKNSRRMVLLAAMVMISIHCFMEQHLLEIAFNPFVLCVFAELGDKKKNNDVVLEIDKNSI